MNFRRRVASCRKRIQRKIIGKMAVFPSDFFGRDIDSALHLGYGVQS